ncbi:uncharacterized protein LOC132193210 [Neocloeon triangulifer]|uniref:uncharacterized protein LOC132193210 n=1 Tax=Neocloeon triangulifer TaxID=2078957 RepID=UPI00286ED415|nr:uncharacterized protein LOC132193210 [Neocloeon triangulifer]XP_059469687.1 uncharacterized protein LOC132193210 [Neocloeon triangulifer]
MMIGHDFCALFLSIVLLLLALSGVTALKCFHCEGNCKEADMGDPNLCRPGFDVCMKVHSERRRVERVCGTLDACGYGVSENWGRRLIRQLKDVMGNAQKRSPWEQDEYEKRTETFCCDTDFCNGALKVGPLFSVVLVTTCLLHLFNRRILFI